MIIGKPQTGRAASTVQGLTTGVCTSLIITLAGAFILAILIGKEILPWEKTGYAIIPVLMGAAFIGAYISWKQIKRLRMMVCLLSGMLYWVTLMCISALIYGGKFEAVFVTGGIIMAGCCSAFLLSTPKQAHKKYRKPKIYPR